MLYEVSSESPPNHSTKPSGIDRQAEPEAILASLDNSFSERLSPAALTPATVSAAKPEADEERPVATEKS